MNNEVLYKKILDDLLEGIRLGKYPAGSRLPSEMKLAEQYNVSRITSKKAVEILADRGYVMRKPGKGTFVLQIDSMKNSAATDLVSEEQENPYGGKSIIGVIMDSFDSSFGLDVVKGLEYECRRRGMLMMLRLTYGSVEVEKEAMQEMREAGVRGLILMCAQGEVYNTDILKLYLEKFPIILIDRGLKGVPIPTVCTDNYTASYELTKVLVEKGHRRIGFISHSYLTTSTISDRFEGFCNALSELDVPMDESLLSLNMDAFLPEDNDNEVDTEVYHVLLADYVERHPDVTAYVTVEHRIASLLYRVLKEKGIDREKTLACFDSDNDMQEMKNLMYVQQDQYRMGVSAMRLMAHKLRGELLPTREVVPYTLYQPEN